MLSQKFWHKYFTVYDTLNELIPYQELLISVVDKLNPKPGDFIFDAGSGTGNLSKILIAKGSRVIGMDFSQIGVEMHRKKIPNAEVLLGDLTKPLPFPDNHFDKIASNNVLYTFPATKQKDILTEFYRVLKPGGILVVTSPIKGWSPLRIYLDGTRKELQGGVFRGLKRIIKMIWSALLIFYYNRKIQSEAEFCFFNKNSVLQQLSDVGFCNSETINVYSNQGYLIKASK